MDWVGTASTAVVGLAGIAATVWTGANGLRHQSRRVELEHKRRAYINLFGVCDRVVNAVRHVRGLPRASGGDAGDPAERALAITTMRGLRLEFNTAMYELQLVCPPQVRDAAEELRLALRERAGRAERGEEDFSVREIRRRLLDLMRADLGHPPLATDEHSSQ